MNKITLNELATMGFRENYLNSLAALNRSTDNVEDYINKLIESQDTTAIDIALVLLEKENIDLKRLEEERNNI